MKECCPDEVCLFWLIQQPITDAPEKTRNQNNKKAAVAVDDDNPPDGTFVVIGVRAEESPRGGKSS